MFKRKVNDTKKANKEFKAQKRQEFKRKLFEDKQQRKFDKKINKRNQKQYYKEAVNAAIKGNDYDTTKLRGNKWKQFKNRIQRPFRTPEGKRIADVEYNIASSDQGKRSAAGETLKIDRQRDKLKFKEKLRTRRELGGKAIEGGAFLAAMGALGKGMKDDESEDESSR